MALPPTPLKGRSWARPLWYRRAIFYKTGIAGYDGLSPSRLTMQDNADYTTAGVLGGLELLSAQYYRQNFAKHTHEGYTVAVIEHGAQRFYRSGGQHLANQHSIILVNADDVHTGQSATDYGWAYRAMYPTPEQFQTVCADLFEGRDGIPYFPQAVVHDPELATQLRLVFGQLRHSQDRLLNETLLYSVMTRLVLRHSRSRHAFRQDATPHRALNLVKEYLDDFPAAESSLEDLARLANLSPFYLVRQFKRHFGLPPHAYQIQARLRLARKLLRQGIGPAQVAVDCGFHDQSHLTTHFKRAMGAPPGQYARQRNLLQA